MQMTFTDYEVIHSGDGAETHGQCARRRAKVSPAKGAIPDSPAPLAMMATCHRHPWPPARPPAIAERGNTLHPDLT